MDPRLKRQILSQAVDDNVSIRDGRRPASPPRPSSPPRSRRVWWFVAASAPLLLLLGLWMGRSPSASPEPGMLGNESAPQPGQLGSGHVDIDFTQQMRFPEPRLMDMRALPLEVRRIVLDPGHGGEDLGTTGGELAEKTLTLDIALRLAKLLEKDGLEVEMTRRDDRFISLKDRAEQANRSQADLFVSIHINWLATREVRGIETYYLGPTDDPHLIELARLENRQSGYRLAEMKPLLEQIYTDVLQSQSLGLASRVQRSLFTSLKKVNPELKNRGVKTAPFVVLVSTEMPAILAEVSCLSNQDEAALLSRPYYRDHIAQALARGIRGYADDVHQTEEKGS